MKLNQTLSGCEINTGSKWARFSAAAMGGSFFFRMIYYFGLMNLRDLGGGEIFFGLILPALTAVCFVLAMKVPALKMNVIYLALAAISAVNYFLTTRGTVGIICGVLQLIVVALFGAVCLGKLPKAEYLPLAGLAVLAVRILFCDLFGFILPLGEFAPVPYVAQVADLFAMAALTMLYLTVRPVKASAPAASQTT